MSEIHIIASFNYIFEYILIGTLLSFGTAIATGLAVLGLIRLA
jgi:hypothetical protein